MIMTLNLVTRDYPGTRDFAVIDTSRTDVSAIADAFNADFVGRSITPPDGSNLVWSPANAQASVLSVINHSAHTLAVENEEMGDLAVTSALAAAARRGVNVKIVMTADAEWDHAFSELSSAGAHIRLYPDSGRFLYVHAKVIIADARQTRPAGADRITDILGRQPRLQPRTRRPKPQRGNRGSRQRHGRPRLRRRQAVWGESLGRQVHSDRDRVQRQL